MRTSGTARSSPRPTAPSHDGSASGSVATWRTGALDARPVPASMPSSAQAPIASTTDAERRVTARPENAAIERPGEHGGAKRCRGAPRTGRRGSPRTRPGRAR